MKCDNIVTKGNGSMFSRKVFQNRKFMFVRADRLFCSSFSPRRDFEGEEALCQSIRENGLTEPLIVRPLEKNKYTVVSGERRLRAAKAAGLVRLPCVILRQSDQKAAVSILLHSLCHKELNIFEQAEGIYNLISRYGLQREEAAELLGMSESELMSKLRLLNFNHWQREKILALGLSERQARAILKIPDDGRRDRELVCRAAETALDIPPENQPTVRKTAVGDERIITNTVLRAVESMKKAGVSVLSERTETDGFVQYKITVPKLKKTE